MTGVLDLLADTARSVALAVTPLALLFLLFQALFLRLPATEVSRVLAGTLLAALGLLLFLAGASLAFLPFGRLIGESLAKLPSPWLMLAVGLVLGFVTAWGEPSVRILADEVEDVSGGSIRRRVVLVAICAGVAVSVGLGLTRIGAGVDLLHVVLPGYAAVLVLMALSERTFVGIAADAGGVATGPLANSFLLALALGVASGLGKDPLVHGFGLVALIALAPVLSVMMLGLLIRSKWPARRS